MTVAIVLLCDAERLQAKQLRWPLRIAVLEGRDITFLMADGSEAAGSSQIALRANDQGGESVDTPFAHDLQALLDEELTPAGWVEVDQRREVGAERISGERKAIRVVLRSVPMKKLAPEAIALASDPRRDLVVSVSEKVPKEITAWREINRELWRDATCRFVSVVPGRRQADGEILFEPSRGPYPRAATPLAVGLAQRYERESTAVWNEPLVTTDSKRVGLKLLDGALKSAVGRDAEEVARNVEIAEPQEESGLLKAASEDRFEVCVVGLDRPSGDDFGSAGPVIRLTRVETQPTWIFTRSAVPLRGRLVRRFEYRLRRIVPQLAREERADFVARVQSSSEWNFDFVALMALASAIATFGLIGDSGAVIIGAMLVAPLMTPLMGIGTSIVQSNVRLAVMTARTSLLGFVLAFLLALGIGLLDTEFGAATDEMYARHWPTLVDLAVAFVAGMAAAYASGRPGLLAALPGVAIAASLVPPIASSGLATALGDFDLAVGAMLLFLVNVVAIVFATALVLWAVGMHGGRPLGVPGKMLAATVFALTIAMAIGLAVSRPRSAAPLALMEQVEAVLGDEYRIREIHLRYEGRPLLQIDLGGSIHDHPELIDDGLVAIARQHLGDRAVVRISYRHERLIQ